MNLPENKFKEALLARRSQIGLWLGMCNHVAAEITAGAGFDWLLIDTEHAPNTIENVLHQLQAVAAYAAHPVVRPGWNDAVEIKRLLDIGVQTLLIPMVQNAEQAAAAVAATRYPPQGIRGVGSALARASRWNRVTDYLTLANDQVCVLVQVETRAALANIEAICDVEGVDGVFIGPADLASDMGLLGKPTHPEVQAAVTDAMRRIIASGKAAGILMSDLTLAEQYVAQGSMFTAVGVDTSLLARGAEALATRFIKSGNPQKSNSSAALGAY
jgi:4-hydroxy-2-oxoheptanedioate aldolase